MQNFFQDPIIIYNPNAAGGKAKKNFSVFMKMLEERKVFDKIEVFESFSRVQTIEKIQEIHQKKQFDLIIGLGGDGTISAICNGLMKIPLDKRLPVFPVPNGSGNSLLRDFNVFNKEQALDAFLKKQEKMLDIIHVKSINSQWETCCINVLGFGFISDMAEKAVKLHKKWGAFTYVIALFSIFKKFRPYDTVIDYNKGKNKFQSKKVYFITISNSMFTGGSVMVAPYAKYDDGLLDVVVLHDFNRIKFLKGFIKALKGKHLHDKGCFFFQTDELTINANPDYILMPDGELEGKSPVKISILKKQIKFIL